MEGEPLPARRRTMAGHMLTVDTIVPLTAEWLPHYEVSLAIGNGSEIGTRYQSPNKYKDLPTP